MTDAEFNNFVATCSTELARKQARLEEQFGLGRHARWVYDGNMSIHHLSAAGCYRGPAKHLYVFFAIDQIAAIRGR